jgi:SulP family sulfate permease
LPFLAWRDRLTKQNLRADLFAGLTGAVVALPQGVAFATIAGMPPQYGLYAGMVPAVVAALWGSSWYLVSGPTTAASLVLFSALSPHAPPGTPEYVTLALTLTFMVGIIELAMGLARLGVLVNFISHSVVTGFTAGAALLIAGSQLRHFFGLEVPGGAHLHDTLYAVGIHLGEANPYATLVGVATLLAGVLLRRYLPRIPYMIVAMLVGVAVYGLIMLWSGQEPAAVRTVGALPAALPPLSAPELTLANLKILAPAAFATTLFALTEAVSIGRALGARGGQQLDGNQEFFGQGLSNMAGSFFSGYVATGSFNRSALNYQAGARTPLAAVLAGVLLALVVLLVAPYAAYLPNAAMAGILILVAWGLIDFHHISRILRSSRQETAILVTTFLATLFLELEFAIFLGVLLSLVLYLRRTSQPHVLERVPDPRHPKRAFSSDPALPRCPQLRIVRIDGSLFFGAISHVRSRLRAMERRDPERRSLLLVATGINFIDLEGADFLLEETRRRRQMGGDLYLYDIKEEVCEVFRLGGHLSEIGEGNLFDSKTTAIAQIFERLDQARCLRCTERIFLECQALPERFLPGEPSVGGSRPQRERHPDRLGQDP